MDETQISTLAYAMEAAYREKKTQGEAIENVKDKYPNSDLNILWAMWSAIDAYIDINL